MKKQPRAGRAAKPLSGGARLKASGKRAMLIGWPKDGARKIEAAAKAEGRPMAQFVMHHALMAAEKILSESGKKT